MAVSVSSWSLACAAWVLGLSSVMLAAMGLLGAGRSGVTVVGLHAHQMLLERCQLLLEVLHLLGECGVAHHQLLAGRLQLAAAPPDLIGSISCTMHCVQLTAQGLDLGALVAEGHGVCHGFSTLRLAASSRRRRARASTSACIM